jgi:hypothetical protein
LFAEFDAKVWDQEFEEDVAGRLEALAEEALRNRARAVQTVRHRASPKFWQFYNLLPAEEKLADETINH